MRATLALVAFCSLAGALSAEIVDRIAVTLGNQVITESELLREIKIAAFLNGAKPDFSPDAKRKAAERLIEQKLVRKEMTLERDPPPSSQEGDEMLAHVEKQRPPGELRAAGLTREEIKDHLIWQAALLRFIDFRFRPAVQVSEEDIQKHYREHYPDAGNKPAPDEIREQIIQTLTAERADQQMDAWLKFQRGHTHVEFHEEAFR